MKHSTKKCLIHTLLLLGTSSLFPDQAQLDPFPHPGLGSQEHVMWRFSFLLWSGCEGMGGRMEVLFKLCDFLELRDLANDGRGKVSLA